MFYGSCQGGLDTPEIDAGTGFFTSACHMRSDTLPGAAGAHLFNRSGQLTLAIQTVNAAAPFMRACLPIADTLVRAASTRPFTVPAIFEMSPNIGLPERLFNRSGHLGLVTHTSFAAAPFYEAGHLNVVTQSANACFAFSPSAFHNRTDTQRCFAGAHFSRTPATIPLSPNVDLPGSTFNRSGQGQSVNQDLNAGTPNRRNDHAENTC